MSSGEAENEFCVTMAEATKQWQRWSAALKGNMDQDTVTVAETGAMRATHEVSLAHYAWTRARNEKGDVAPVALEPKCDEPQADDPFPSVKA